MRKTPVSFELIIQKKTFPIAESSKPEVGLMIGKFETKARILGMRFALRSCCRPCYLKKSLFFIYIIVTVGNILLKHLQCFWQYFLDIPLTQLIYCHPDYLNNLILKE